MCNCTSCRIERIEANTEMILNILKSPIDFTREDNIVKGNIDSIAEAERHLPSEQQQKGKQDGS